MMKLVVFGLLFSCVVACGTTKPVEQEDPYVRNVVGVVKMTHDLCKDQIIVNDTTILDPTNLMDKHQVDGLKIQFDYIPTVVHHNLACQNIEPIMVENVTVLKE